MALTGLQIQKLLPKTNCKECGVNTCLAFAMKLAARKTEIGDLVGLVRPHRSARRFLIHRFGRFGFSSRQHLTLSFG